MTTRELSVRALTRAAERRHSRGDSLRCAHLMRLATKVAALDGSALAHVLASVRRALDIESIRRWEGF